MIIITIIKADKDSNTMLQSAIPYIFIFKITKITFKVIITIKKNNKNKIIKNKNNK